MKQQVLDVISGLCFGDLIEVEWLDASEATGSLKGGHFDTPVQSVGYFLGLKGKRVRHVVIAKEVVDDENFHYNVIPVGMIVNVTVQRKNALKPRTRRVLKKFAQGVIPKLRRKDGWAYARKRFKRIKKKEATYIA